MFAEKGESAVVPDIAARAGVGKGTVYRCFPTKEHLVAAVATERARWFEREARAAAADADPWSAFGAFLARVAEAYCRDRGMVFSMSQGLETPERLEARAAVMAALRELMDRAIAQGAMRAGRRAGGPEGPAQRRRELAHGRAGARSGGLAALRAAGRRRVPGLAAVGC